MTKSKDIFIVSGTGVVDILPLTITKDVYKGIYSGGKFAAWNLDHTSVLEEIDNGFESSCKNFWNNKQALEYFCPGVGNTIELAIQDLNKKLLIKNK